MLLLRPSCAVETFIRSAYIELHLLREEQPA